MESDKKVKQINLHDYDYIMINSSGGKDSQTALRFVMRLVGEQAYPRDNIVVVHADLGKMEWKGTKDLAEAQARHYGLEFIVVARRQKDGSGDTILEYAERRGKWPSATQRWCTSDFKRGPANRVITQLSKRCGKRKHHILSVFGFRAEESPARAKREVLAENVRLRTKLRRVDDWLPIHNWTEEDVWKDIKDSSVSHHHAYNLGMPRLSCVFCIFAPRAALIVAGHHNRELLDEYCEVEHRIGHTFRHKLPIADIRDAVERGENPDMATACDGCWNM